MKVFFKALKNYMKDVYHDGLIKDAEYIGCKLQDSVTSFNSKTKVTKTSWQDACKWKEGSFWHYYKQCRIAEKKKGKPVSSVWLVILILVFAAFLVGTAHAIVITKTNQGFETFTASGTVRVIDGDTIEVKQKNLNPIKVRLGCIDTPESKYRGKTQYCLDNETDCGKLASEHLEEIIKYEGEGYVTCMITNKDMYQRYIGICWAGKNVEYKKVYYIGEHDINAMMVYEGYAWPLTDYDKSCKYYEELFEEARKEKRGLFNDNIGGFKEPKQWRKIRTND